MRHTTVKSHVRKGRLVRSHTRKTSSGKRLVRIAVGTGIILLTAGAVASIFGRMRH